MSTISDVASAAGVSTATVSRVLNDHPGVNPASAARVRQAMKKLDYRPSRAARTLRTRQSQVWSLIISDIQNPFFTDLIAAVEKIAYDAGYSLILANAGEDPVREAGYLQLAIEEAVSGVILVPTRTKPSRLKAVQAAGIPVVTVDRRHTEDGLDCVLVDNVAGGKLAADHLAGNGFTRIACITGPLTTTTGADRLAGYRQALEGRGLPVLPELARVSDFTEDGGYTEMESLLGGRSRPDAVFVANNVMTVGALRAVADAGLRVPEDIAVVGFDDMTWSRLLRPPLTTVAQPTYDLGEETARLLLTRLRGYTGAPRQVVLSPTLRVRASSAARTPALRSPGGDRAVRPAKGRPASPGGSRSSA